jgi:hypothetical protein
MNKDPKYIINFLVNRYFIKFINNSCITFKIIDELQKDLSFSEKDYKDFKIVENKTTGQISWKNSIEKEVEIGPVASDIICDALSKVDKAGKFDIYYFELSKKFNLDDFLKEQEKNKEVKSKTKK